MVWLRAVLDGRSLSVMNYLRTPDSAFDSLTDYGFKPHYVEIEDDGLRMHHIDEGDGPTVLLLHGEPSWSYLYRGVIPVLVEAGLRVLAPDLIGFGRSDKPVAQSDYSYAKHVAWLQTWFDAVEIDDVTLFAQDWGGLLGLRLVAANMDRFAAVCIGNTGLPTGDQSMPDAFLAWREFSKTASEFDVGRIINGGTVSNLSSDVLAGYNAPFPDDSYKAGARIFPSLVPVTPNDPEATAQRAAWAKLVTWNKPFVTAFSDSDPITGGGDRVFHKLIPGSSGMPNRTIESAGHFLQEDAPDAVAQAIMDTLAES